VSRAAAVALALALAGAAVGQESALSGAAAVPGWTAAGSLERYRGAELYGFINGGAELFLELGFEELVVQDYARAGVELSVELYQMEDPTAALAIFLDRGGDRQPAPGVPARSNLGRQQLTMVRGSTYAVLTAKAGDRDALVAFAKAIAPGLPDTPPPDLEGAVAGAIPGTVRLIRGPFGLQSLLTLGDGDVLRLGGERTAVAAQVERPSGRSLLVLADYPDDQAAAAALAHLRGKLDPYLEVVRSEDDHIAFRDHGGKPGAVRRTGARITVELAL
jgi:hypothetical protein